MEILSPWPFFLPYTVPALTVFTQHVDNDYLSILPVIFIWVVLPAVDFIIAYWKGRGHGDEDKRAMSEVEKNALESCISFRIAIYLWPPTQFTFLLWTINRLTFSAVTPVQAFSLMSSMILISAEGINCAHELLHRKSSAERFLGDLLLYSVCYGHFSIEHSKGHHVNVATPKDPATLRYGQSFYSFLPRTIFGGVRSAWNIEARRIGYQNKNKGPVVRVLETYSPIHNHVVKSFCCEVAIIMFMKKLFGLLGVKVFLFQSACAVILLEQINAIEHYGLRRKKLSDGSYEPVGAQHSWDAPFSVSSYFMFKLQLHAHHHLHVSHRYQVLRLMEGSPKLPAGYLSLAPLLWVPPLWRFVMDPIVERHNEKLAQSRISMKYPFKHYAQQ